VVLLSAVLRGVVRCGPVLCGDLCFGVARRGALCCNGPVCFGAVWPDVVMYNLGRVAVEQLKYCSSLTAQCIS
jgi:hypothetical protein